MQDNRLEERKKNFQHVDTNILEARENYKLSLRKQKVDDYFMSKRIAELKNRNSQKSVLEINPDMLLLPPEIRNPQINDSNQFITFLKELLLSTEIDRVKFATYLIRKELMDQKTQWTQEMVKNHIPELLLATLDKYLTDDSISYEILWSFVNFTGGSSQSVGAILLTPKAIRIWENILNCKPINLKEEMIWILANISTDNIENRNIVMGLEIYPNILNRIATKDESVNSGLFLDNAISLIANIHKITGYSEPQIELTKTAARIACEYFQNEQLKPSCLWALSYISLTGKNEILYDLFISGVCQEILTKPLYLEKKYIAPSLRLLGNIMSGPDIIIDDFIKCGILKYLKYTVEIKEYTIIRRESFWCLSNILAGTKAQVKAVVHSELYPCILDGITDNTKEVIFEASMCLKNLTTGCDLDDACLLIKGGIYNAMIALLDIGNPEIMINCLEALYGIFDQGAILININQNNPLVEAFIQAGGGDVLEKCQDVENKAVADMAVAMLKKYFQLD